MGIKNILELELSNTQIILHNEGLFLRAYERSAYLFAKHIKGYNIIKKFYKNVKQKVVYLGFPQSSFSKIKDICKEQNISIKEEKNQIEITGFKSFTEKEFTNWKNEIALWQSFRTLPKLLLKENIIIEKISLNRVSVNLG